MKNRNFSIILAVIFILLPGFAFANASWGVISLFESALYIIVASVIITVFLEAQIIKLMLKLSYFKSLVLSFGANIASGIFGLFASIPFMMIFEDEGLNVKPLVALNDNNISNNIIAFWLFFLLCFVFSFFIEASVLKRLNKGTDSRKIIKTSLSMNTLSYILFFIYFAIRGIGYGDNDLTLAKSIKHLLSH